MTNLGDARFGPTGGIGYEARTSPAERRNFFDLRKLLSGVYREAATKMEWKGTWLNQDYDYNDVVRDDGWTMVCATEGGCDEKPAPYPTGDPFYIYAGADPTTAQLAKQILFGNRYTFPTSGYLTGYRVWTVAGNSYTIYSVLDPDGVNKVTELLSFTGTGGWEQFGLSDVIITEGTMFELLCIVQEPDPTPTTFTGNWDYDTPPQNSTPASGVISQSNAFPTSLRIHKTDNNGGDRSAELAGMEVGDTIASPNIRWAIQAISDNGTWIDFTVAPGVQDAPDGVTSFTFETVSATPITILQDVGYWPTTTTTAQGVFAVDGATPALDTNAYGTDIQVQAGTVSDQWEVIATPGGGAGGSTGQSYSQQLETLGTHTDFYEMVKNPPIDDLPETWTLIGLLAVELPDDGTYEVGASTTWNFTRVNRSTYTRFRINGGDWYENVREPKDATDVYQDYYAYPAEYAAGPLSIEVEMRKEDITGTLDLKFHDIWVERKK